MFFLTRISRITRLAVTGFCRYYLYQGLNQLKALGRHSRWASELVPVNTFQGLCGFRPRNHSLLTESLILSNHVIREIREIRVKKRAQARQCPMKASV